MSTKQRENGVGTGWETHQQREMKAALRKRNEGGKSRNQTSDQENEIVQRKWVGKALREESPMACCFLSSWRTGWDWLTTCSLVVWA